MNRPVVFVSLSEADTDWLGGVVASQLTQGITIALNGQLGSGKTRFTRALCSALEIDTALVTSPTFVLMQLYTDGRLPVAHFDTYRLGDIDEFAAIGAEEFLSGEEWVCLVEWADRVDEILPADRLTIRIQHESESSRHFEFTSSGSVSSQILTALATIIPPQP